MQFANVFNITVNFKIVTVVKRYCVFQDFSSHLIICNLIQYWKPNEYMYFPKLNNASMKESSQQYSHVCIDHAHKHANTIKLLPFHASHTSLEVYHREQFCLQLDPSLRVLCFPKKEIGHLMKRVPHFLYLAHCFKNMNEKNIIQSFHDSKINLKLHFLRPVELHSSGVINILHVCLFRNNNSSHT